MIKVKLFIKFCQEDKICDRFNSINKSKYTQQLLKFHGNEQKKGTLKIQKSQIAILVLNQSPISVVFSLVRFAGDPKTALTGDILGPPVLAFFFLLQFFTKTNICIFCVFCVFVFYVIQEIPAFRDFTIRGPLYFAILFWASFEEKNPKIFFFQIRFFRKYFWISFFKFLL